MEVSSRDAPSFEKAERSMERALAWNFTPFGLPATKLVNVFGLLSYGGSRKRDNERSHEQGRSVERHRSQP